VGEVEEAGEACHADDQEAAYQGLAPEAVAERPRHQQDRDGQGAESQAPAGRRKFFGHHGPRQRGLEHEQEPCDELKGDEAVQVWRERGGPCHHRVPEDRPEQQTTPAAAVSPVGDRDGEQGAEVHHGDPQ
jgi:hypothetical protein